MCARFRSGDPIDAETACEWGLINRVVRADELEAEVSALVAKVAGSSALTVSIGKEAFYKQIDLDEPAPIRWPVG